MCDQLLSGLELAFSYLSSVLTGDIAICLNFPCSLWPLNFRGWRIQSGPSTNTLANSVFALIAYSTCFRTIVPPEQEEVVLIKEVESEPQENSMSGNEICRKIFFEVFKDT